MVSTIRHLFTFNKKTHQQKSTPTSRQSSLSPSSSIASLSTLSDSPQTPTNPEQSFFSPQDIRGIFRTLDPYWSFYHPQQQCWLAFGVNAAELLEYHYQRQDTPCLQLSSLPDLDNGCTIHFQPSRQQGNGLQLTMGHDVVRTVAPVWWFEQDMADGTKGMCRFENKNQVRLEALSEDRTQLSLTDEGFQGATMTVVTTPPQQPGEEEMRGLLYVYQPQQQDSLGQKMGQHFDHITAIMGDDDVCLSPRRGSI
ncbi:hypothetical protein BC941DRAFT_419034 [Chlamydoabsidia padenii]|nr:hypothetical protein BC941DRAFT_419034 [Chlamydoabsidia padenii]